MLAKVPKITAVYFPNIDQAQIFQLSAEIQQGYTQLTASDTRTSNTMSTMAKLYCITGIRSITA